MPELGFKYELTRSDRRTLSIKISRDAKVLVYACLLYTSDAADD